MSDHCAKAARFPHKYIAVRGDGMDQSKTSIPRLLQMPKSLADRTLPTHIYGIITNRDTARMYIDFRQIPHDIDSTLSNVLQSVVQHVNDSGTALPPTLLLSFDNTSAENKNRYMLGMCAYLVGARIFEKVKLTFQLVGHTHNEVDGLFGSIASRFKSHEVRTPDELIESVKSANRTIKHAFWVYGSWGYRAFISPHLLKVSGFKYVHCFKFKLGVDGEPRLWWKTHTGEKEWRPQNKDGLLILKEGTCQYLDLSTIELVKAKWTENTALEDICRGENSLRDRFRSYLDNQQYESWSRFEEKIKAYCEDPDLYKRELHEAEPEPIAALKQLASQMFGISHSERDVLPPPADDDSLDEQSSILRSIREKNRRNNEIVTGSSKRPSLAAGSEIPDVGSYVFINPDDETEEDWSTTPWMGKVVAVKEAERTFSFQWMESSSRGRTGTWTPLFLKPDRKGKRKTAGPWIEKDFSFETILVYNIKLTKSGKLAKSSVRRWVEAMDDIGRNIELSESSAEEDE